MKKLAPGIVAGTATLALGLTALSPAVAAPSSDAPSARDAARVRPDNLPNPLAKKQAKLRKQALEALAHGKAERKPQRGGGSVLTTATGKKVELFDNDKQANVWTVLSEFGDEVTGAGGEAGPLHNQIPEPDRDKDNSTQWTADFNLGHFDEMFNGEGESFRNYYLDQSNGEYTATVTTEDWVQVPRNGNYYGDNANEAQGYWDFIDDTVVPALNGTTTTP